MPLYEYHCTHCDRAFERYARTFNDQPDCPTCGAMEVTKLLSTFAVSAGASARSSPAEACGVGPPCGAPRCGRLAN